VMGNDDRRDRIAVGEVAGQMPAAGAWLWFDGGGR
jgi:hypothetical protein